MNPHNTYLAFKGIETSVISFFNLMMKKGNSDT